MAIEFDKSHPLPVNPATGTHTGGLGVEHADANQKTPAPGTASDAVTLTDTSHRISDLVAAAGREPPVNKQQVEALRDAIADGSYQVNNEAVAEKMLQLEEDLFK